MDDEWVEKLAAAAKEHHSLIVLDEKCLGCAKSDMLCKPIVLKTKLNFKWLEDHKSLLTIVCLDCAKNMPPVHKIMQNIIKKLLTENPGKELN